MMLTKTTMIKKTVCHGHKQFKLVYSLLLEDDIRYGIRVDCCYGNTTETECTFTGRNRAETLRLLYLFAKETVFPVALQETFANL